MIVRRNQSYESLIVGSFPTDNQGFLIPVAQRTKIHDVWQDPLKEIVSKCKEIFSQASIYVRGSVAAGTALERLSDIDVMIIVTYAKDSQYKSIDKVAQEVLDAYPTATEVDLEVITEAEMKQDKSLQLRLSTEAHHLSGSHHWSESLRFKPGREIIRHAPAFRENFTKVPNAILKATDLRDLQVRILRAAKQLIRLGMELVIERSKEYSRELPVCIEIFSNYYPEKVYLMNKALLFVNNTNTLTWENKEAFLQLWNDLGEWLCCRLEEEFSFEQQSLLV